MLSFKLRITLISRYITGSCKILRPIQYQAIAYVIADFLPLEYTSVEVI